MAAADDTAPKTPPVRLRQHYVYRPIRWQNSGVAGRHLVSICPYLRSSSLSDSVVSDDLGPLLGM